MFRVVETRKTTPPRQLSCVEKQGCCLFGFILPVLRINAHEVQDLNLNDFMKCFPSPSLCDVVISYFFFVFAVA